MAGAVGRYSRASLGRCFSNFEMGSISRQLLLTSIYRCDMGRGTYYGDMEAVKLQ